MGTDTQTASVSKGALVTGWILSVLPALFMLASAIFKLLQPPGFEEGFTKLGYSPSQAAESVAHSAREFAGAPTEVLLRESLRAMAR